MVPWTDTSLWIFLGFGIASTSTFILTILFLYHLFVTIKIWTTIFKQSKSSHDAKENSKNQLILPILMLLIILFYIILSINNLIASTQEVLALKPDCLFAYKFASFWSVLTKSSLYLLFTYRLYVSFKYSIYAYNKKLLLFICSIIMIQWGLFTMASFVYVDTEEVTLVDYFNENTSNEKEYYWCVLVVPYYIILPWVGTDLMFNILLSILFIKPIIALHKSINQRKLKKYHQNTDNNDINKNKNHDDENKNNTSSNNNINNNNNHDSGFERLAIKTSIIVVVTLVTSIIVLIILFFGWGVIVTIDWTLNSFCIVLMLKNYDKWYQKCCCICIKFCNQYNKQ